MGKLSKTRDFLILTVLSAVLVSTCLDAAENIRIQHERAMEAYRSKRWEEADALAARALRWIEISGSGDWTYRGDRNPLMTYFTGEYVFLATSDKDQSWNLNRVEIHDPADGKLIRVVDFSPWYVFESTHSPNHTIIYLNRIGYIGYKVVWFEAGRPEGERTIVREGIEDIDVKRIIDADVIDILEKGPGGWGLTVFDPATGSMHEVHTFRGIDPDKKAWDQYKIIKNPNAWNFIDGNRIYSLAVGTWEKKLLFTLPFAVSPHDVFSNEYTEKLTAVRNDTLFMLRPAADGSCDMRVVHLPHAMNINHATKKIDDDGSGGWFAQSDADSLRIFRPEGTNARPVHATASCLGGDFALRIGTFWKGDTLIHHGNSGVKIFKGYKPLYESDAEDMIAYYVKEKEILTIYNAPGEFSALGLNPLRTLWTKRYTTSHTSIFSKIADKYLAINHVDGTSLVDIETGTEVFRVPFAATRNRHVNRDTTKVLLHGDNALGVYEISETKKLKSDLIAVAASSKWGMQDTSGTLLNVREALALGTNLSGDLTKNLSDILSSLNLQKEYIRLIGDMAIRTGSGVWIDKLKNAGSEVFIEPHLADFFAIIVLDKGIFAFPVIVYPHTVIRDEERKCYWFPGPGYRGEKSMIKLAGLSISSQGNFFFSYSRSENGNAIVWNPLHLKETGELVNLGKLMETRIETKNPQSQLIADYAVDAFPLSDMPGDRVLTNFSLSERITGRMTFAAGFDLTGRGKNWIDTMSVNPVRIGNRYYLHRKYGHLIETVAEGSQADSIGIRVGDIVISFGGYREGMLHYVNRIKTYYPDRAPLDLTVTRDGDTLHFTVLNGRIGYRDIDCFNLVEVDPDTGEYLDELEIPQAFWIKALNSSGELVYQRDDSLLFFNPLTGSRKRVMIKGITDFDPMPMITHADLMIMYKRGPGDILAVDISITANDADRVLWKQSFDNLYRMGGDPVSCFSTDEEALPVLLANGTLLLLDPRTGTVLSRETLPFQNFGFNPQLVDGNLYGTVASNIFGWRVVYYHPPFPWKYMGYGASALVPLLFVSLLINRFRIEKLKKRQVAELRRAEVDAEISAVRRLQEGLIPAGSHRLGRFHLVGKIIPTSDVGGDYFDFRLLDDGRLVVVMGDVSGHGLQAGIMVSMAKASLMTVHRSAGSDLKDMLESLNEVIRFGSAGKEMFMTLCYLILDPAAGRIGCSANGHPFPLIARSDGTVSEVGPLGGYSPGIRDDQAFHIVETDFRPGDTLLLYTDGLPEQVNVEGEPWGYNNLIRTFKELAMKNDIEWIADKLLERTLRYAGTSVGTDDITVVTIRYSEE